MMEKDKETEIEQSSRDESVVRYTIVNLTLREGSLIERETCIVKEEVYRSP